MEEEQKKIEIISGNGKDLEISEVSTHLSIAKPKFKDTDDKKKEIVIPQVKKKTDNKENKKIGR